MNEQAVKPEKIIPYAEIESKWQRKWTEAAIFKAPRTPRPGKKFYCLDMFPYPSADGLHVGHPEGYAATDILSRLKRRQGFDVLHPMGWDAFGLPAENFALQTGAHPRDVTQKNIGNFRRQIQSLGFSYDWDREIDTTNADYYRWTQWIFIQLFKKGLAYESTIPINWCPSCKTGLANEEVFNGKCERCQNSVERRDMRQWLLKITEYADRLLSDLEGLDWPESTLSMQRNWIGRSEGARVSFKIHAPGLKADGQILEVFTTRPDTLYGATYLVLAPEHRIIPDLIEPKDPDKANPEEMRTAEKTSLTTSQKKEIEAYIASARSKSDMERTELQKDKTGVPTESFAVNPVNGAHIPIWIADYVLAGYGTGAIMAVPGHDERDHAFAKKFKLPILQVVRPMEGALDKTVAEEAYCEEGIAVNSSAIEGLPTSAAKKKIVSWLEARKMGTASVQYKLRDWVFSRQRYWGEPIPIIHCAKCGAVAVPESDLPVRLPDVKEYKPTGTGESPLASIPEWVAAPCPQCGGPGRRETNTMPQWAGSCWYYLRYIDPKNTQCPWDMDQEKQWMPVDCYMGGAEHAVLHLLYSRFWHKVLFDLGVVSTPEPFQKLRHQGMILSYAYRDSSGSYHGYSELEIGEGGKAVLRSTKESIDPQVEKMSKSKKNVINPDEIISKYGADSFRMYEMFMGPIEDSKPWDIHGIEGISRFLRRVWIQFGWGSRGWTDGEGLAPLRHRTIAKVTSDIEGMRFNTAISALMIYLNGLNDQGFRTEPSRDGAVNWLSRIDAETFLSLLNPFAPHLTEELWERTGHEGFLSSREWPAFDPNLLKESEVELAVQVNGKVRDRLKVEAGFPEDQIKQKALALSKIQELVSGHTVEKVIVVANRLVNIVVKP